MNDPVVTRITCCIVDRWHRDEPLRIAMMALNCDKVDMEEMDGIAEEPGQESPREGEGRACQATEQTEGCYHRVSRSCGLPETGMAPDSRPQHVRDRTAIRRGERTLFAEESSRHQALE